MAMLHCIKQAFSMGLGLPGVCPFTNMREASSTAVIKQSDNFIAINLTNSTREARTFAQDNFAGATSI
jgi:hypothetical protein